MRLSYRRHDSCPRQYNTIQRVRHGSVWRRHCDSAEQRNLVGLLGYGSITSAGSIRLRPAPRHRHHSRDHFHRSNPLCQCHTPERNAWTRPRKFGGHPGHFSGNGKDATLSGAAAFGGYQRKCLNLSGGNASLPRNRQHSYQFHHCTWVKIDTLSTWSRIFDFGNGIPTNMSLPEFRPAQSAFASTRRRGEQQNHALRAGHRLLAARGRTLSGNTGTIYVMEYRRTIPI